MTDLVAPALLVYRFHEPGTATWAAIAARWDSLGLSRAVAVLGVPTRPTPGAVNSGSRLLAAASAPGSAIEEAFARIEHDTVCEVVVATADGADAVAAWQGWTRRWDAADDGAEPIGDVRVLLALSPRPESARAVLRGSLPGLPGWHRHRDTVALPDGSLLLCWDLTAVSPYENDVRRTFVVLGDPAAEGTVDSLLWTSGDGELPPFARHLMHATKIRSAARAFADGSATRAARERLDRGVDVRDRAGLVAAVSSAATLCARLSRARAATENTSANLARALPFPVSGTGPLTRDVALAGWFAPRLTTESHSLGLALADARRVLGEVPPAPSAVVIAGSAAIFAEVRASMVGEVVELEERGTLYEVGELGSGWRVALTQVTAAGPGAGVELERAVGRFHPDLVIFTCLAVGWHPVRRGDVVVASTVYDYLSGTDGPDGPRRTVKTHHAAHRLVQWALAVARRPRWHRDRRAVVAPIAAGGWVPSSPGSVDAVAADAVAVEVGGFGFLHAAYVNPGSDALVVAGVDRVLGTRARDTGRRAAANAAEFIVELLESVARTAKGP